MSTTLALVHFRTCEARHLRRAFTTVLKQDVERILIYDNSSGTDPKDLLDAIEVRPASGWAGWVPPPEFRGSFAVHFDPHGDPVRTHPYSVNQVVKQVETEWLLFTRSDYLLAPDALAALRHEAERMVAEGLKPFVSGWCYQSAYDRAQQDLPPYDIDTLPWRDDFSVLTDGTVPGYCFHETDLDAGVWLTKPAYLREAGPMNEALSAWGYSQSTYQRVLTQAGVTCRALPRYISFHQQHGVWERDHQVARRQYTEFGDGK